MRTRLCLLAVIYCFLQNNYAQNNYNFAASFNGTNSYVAVVDDPELNPLTAITIEAWINPSSLSNFPTIVGKNWTSNYWFGINPDSKLRFYSHGPTTLFDGSFTIPLNQWTHVAATYDGTVTRLFVNGVCCDSTLAFTGPMTPNTDSLLIGCDRDDPSSRNYFFDGLMNNIRIWNVARTSVQIKENMYSTLLLVNSTGYYKGLVAALTFSQGHTMNAWKYGGNHANYAQLRNMSMVDFSNQPIKVFDYNNWLELDGIDSYCAMENQPDFNATTAISVEAWIRVPETISETDINNRPVVSKTAASFRWDYALFLVGRAVVFSMNSTAANHIIKENAIVDNYWHHLAATYNSVDGQMNLYLDGELANQITLTDKPLISNNSDSLYIGVMSASLLLPYKFSGCIEEVRIWKDVVLSQEQIKSRMFSTRANTSGDSPSCTFGFNLFANSLTTNLSGFNSKLQFFGNAKIGSSHLQTAYTPPLLFGYYFHPDYASEFFVSTHKTKLISGASVFDSVKVTKSGYVTDIKGFVLLNHGAIGSVGISLVSPTGTSVDLLPSKNLTLTDHDLMTLFDDTADSIIDFTNSGYAPFSSLVGPTENFSAFYNSLAAGYWKIKINDASSSDVIRVLNGWGIEVTTTPVDVKETLPLVYSLEQNYPNPFNPSTTIKYSVPKTEHVTLKMFDVLGREVATLVDEEKSAGLHEFNFDAQRFSSGVYFYRLWAGSFVETKKLTLIK